jgi:hypothetical protein
MEIHFLYAAKAYLNEVDVRHAANDYKELPYAGFTTFGLAWMDQGRATMSKITDTNVKISIPYMYLTVTCNSNCLIKQYFVRFGLITYANFESKKDLRFNCISSLYSHFLPKKQQC